MTEHSTEHADPRWPHDESEWARAAASWAQRGSVLPHPATPFPDGTRWIEHVERGRVESADGSSPWGAPDPPAAVPGPIPGVEGPHTRPGWLIRGRQAEPDGAA